MSDSQTISNFTNLSEENRKKVMGYLEERKLQKITQERLPENILSDMVSDLVNRSKRPESYPVFEEYIFTLAVKNVEEFISKDDALELAKVLDESSWVVIFGELLEEKKYLIAFLGGLIFGYTKLAYKLQLEPDTKFTSITNVLPIL